MHVDLSLLRDAGNQQRRESFVGEEVSEFKLEVYSHVDHGPVPSELRAASGVVVRGESGSTSFFVDLYTKDGRLLAREVGDGSYEYRVG